MRAALLPVVGNSHSYAFRGVIVKFDSSVRSDIVKLDSAKLVDDHAYFSVGEMRWVWWLQVEGIL